MENELSGLSKLPITVYTEHKERYSEANKKMFREEVIRFADDSGLSASVHESSYYRFKIYDCVMKKIKKNKWDSLAFFIDKKLRKYKSYNIVLGNVKEAKLIVTAHYDTPIKQSFMIPRSPYHKSVRDLLLTVLFLVVLCICFFSQAGLKSCIYVALVLITSFFFVGLYKRFRKKIPNKTNNNDNTSGVITLLETAMKMPNELEDKIAFILFDNEEKGLKGSMGFVESTDKNGDKYIKSQYILNLDCVGYGDILFFLLPPKLRNCNCTERSLENSFEFEEFKKSKKIIVSNSRFASISSDHNSFNTCSGKGYGISVSALQSSKKCIGVLRDIHTAKDNHQIDSENIFILQNGIYQFVKNCKCFF